MKYIKRSLEEKILQISEDYSCLLLIRPRQVGKTTMLEHLIEGTERTKVTLDDVFGMIDDDGEDWNVDELVYDG